MNSVHAAHKAEDFVECRHFIFTFHDRTFECVVRAFAISLHDGVVDEVLTKALEDGD
jgi:hypothetical protein